MCMTARRKQLWRKQEKFKLAHTVSGKSVFLKLSHMKEPEQLKQVKMEFVLLKIWPIMKVRTNLKIISTACQYLRFWHTTYNVTHRGSKRRARAHWQNHSTQNWPSQLLPSLYYFSEYKDLSPLHVTINNKRLVFPITPRNRRRG